MKHSGRNRPYFFRPHEDQVIGLFATTTISPHRDPISSKRATIEGCVAKPIPWVDELEVKGSPIPDTVEKTYGRIPINA